MMSCSADPEPEGPEGADGFNGDGPPLGRIEIVVGP